MLSRLSPTRSSPRVMMDDEGIAGRSSQSAPRRSGTGTMRAEGTASASSCTASMVWHRPSMAIPGSSSPREAIHSGMGTAPGTRILCNWTPLPSSCFTAWMKKRESVHRPAWSWVMTTSPFSPVKPVSHSTCFQRGAGFSLAWGSLPVRITISQWFSRIRPRKASILEEKIVPIVRYLHKYSYICRK